MLNILRKKILYKSLPIIEVPNGLDKDQFLEVLDTLHLCRRNKYLCHRVRYLTSLTKEQKDSICDEIQRAIFPWNNLDGYIKKKFLIRLFNCMKIYTSKGIRSVWIKKNINHYSK